MKYPYTRSNYNVGDYKFVISWLVLELNIIMSHLRVKLQIIKTLSLYLKKLYPISYEATQKQPVHTPNSSKSFWFYQDKVRFSLYASNLATVIPGLQSPTKTSPLPTRFPLGFLQVLSLPDFQLSPDAAPAHLSHSLAL